MWMIRSCLGNPLRHQVTKYDGGVGLLHPMLFSSKADAEAKMVALVISGQANPGDWHIVVIPEVTEQVCVPDCGSFQS
jgi:hypothetical protein